VKNEEEMIKKGNDLPALPVSNSLSQAWSKRKTNRNRTKIEIVSQNFT